MLEELLRVGFFLPHEAGQEVVVVVGPITIQQLQLAVLDDVGEVLVDVFEAPAQAHFHSEPEPSLQLPQDLRQNKAL